MLTFFLANNDVNITASCFHVSYSSDELFTMHAAPVFWEFLFGKENEHKVSTARPYVAANYGSTTFVCIAFKVFEMELPFSFGGVDCTNGTLAKSQKEKFDKMKKWVDSPFHEYQYNKCCSYYVNVMKKKNGKVKCVACDPKAWANKDCSYVKGS